VQNVDSSHKECVLEAYQESNSGAHITHGENNGDYVERWVLLFA
jgi:hypothetical protein